MDLWDVSLSVGSDEQFSNLSEALSHIPENSHRVLILIKNDFTQDLDVSIPSNQNIQYLKLASFNDNNKIIDFIGCNFFVNGTTLEVDYSITLKDCFIFGGSKSDTGIPVLIPSSQIIIKGSADYVYGGGYAIGPGSISTVQDISIEIEGKVSYLYGGGYAVQAGTVHSKRIQIYIKENGTINRILNGGSSLIGPDCNSIIREININISGKIAGNISLAGYVAYGSSISIHDIVRFSAKTSELYGEVYDGITIDSKSKVDIKKITGSISPENYSLIKFSNHNIEVFQPEPISEFSEEHDTLHENEDTENQQQDANKVDTEVYENQDIDLETAEDEQDKQETEKDESNISDEQSISNEHDHPTNNPSPEIEKIDDPIEKPLIDTFTEEEQHEDSKEKFGNIPSDLNHQDGIENQIEKQDETQIQEEEENGNTEEIPSSDSFDAIDNPDIDSNYEIPKQESYPDGMFNNADNSISRKTDDQLQPKSNQTVNEDIVKGKKKLPLIVIGFFILATLLIICYILLNRKSKGQSIPTIYTYPPTEQVLPSPTNTLSVQNSNNNDVISSEEYIQLPTIISSAYIIEEKLDIATLAPTSETESAIEASPTNSGTTNIEISDTPTTEIVTASTAPTQKLSLTTTTIPITPTATHEPTDTKTTVPSITPTEKEATPIPTKISVTIIPSMTPTIQQYETSNELLLQITETEPVSKVSETTIQMNSDTGTFFYQKPYKSQDLILRWLPNGTKIEIIDGPVMRNNSEWYEIFCKQYNLTGWVNSSAVSSHDD